MPAASGSARASASVPTAAIASAAAGAHVRVQCDACGRWQHQQRHELLHGPTPSATGPSAAVCASLASVQTGTAGNGAGRRLPLPSPAATNGGCGV